MRRFKISGVGQHLPKLKLHSSKLEEELGLENGWIQQHLGVKERYRVVDENNTDLAHHALHKALTDAEIKITDLDHLIAASATFDHVLPGRASLIKCSFKETYNTHFPCIDINSACTSFISAIDYASLLFATSDCTNIAIVSSEISSKGIHPENREPYCLFGDGAASLILCRTDEERGQLKHLTRTYSEAALHTIIPGGGNAYHFRDHEYDADLFSFHMEGQPLLKAALRQLPDFLDEFFSDTGHNLSDIDYIIPHQASKLGLDLLAKINPKGTANIISTLGSYGNCIASSIPLALAHAHSTENLLEEKVILLLGTAAGMNISASLIKT